MGDDTSGDPDEGWTRRDWVKAGLAVGGATAAGTLGYLATRSLTTPVQAPLEEVRDTMYYSRFPTPQWWNSRTGQPIRVTDFQEWQGATGIWRGTFRDGAYVAETGLPVLVIRVKRDDSVFSVSRDIAPPLGFDFFYDDAARDIRIVVMYDRCAHLCCYPGWQVVQNPPPGRDYVAPTPTYEVFGLDPIYCVCHGSQYDPLVLVKNTNNLNGVEYIGPSRVHGPSSRAIPVVPVTAVDDVLVGAMIDKRWYEYC